MKKSILTTITIFFSCVLLSISAHSSSIGESAGEIWIDGPDQPGSDPNQPDADVDSTGRTIFVWDAFTANRKDIFLRVFPADGSDPSDPVRVNTYVDDAQQYPKVAISSDGSFLVVWMSEEEPNPGDGFLRPVVRSQKFDANADPVGDEQLLSTLDPLTTTAKKVDVDALPSGEYIVVWRQTRQSEPDPPPDVNRNNIQGRRVGANGVPLAEQFQVNTLNTSNSEKWPSVTSLADGGFLVVWTDPQVHGRRFAADFTPLGDDFQINTFITGTEYRAVVDRNSVDDRVLVAWDDEEETGDETEIRARLFSPDLAPIGQDFRINTLTEKGQREVEVADYGAGGFFVVWESNVSSGNDPDPRSIEGRIITGSNAFASPQFQVNSWTESSQHHPGLGGMNGRIAVGWHGQSNSETSANVIQGQFWSICGIFCDGFE